MQMWTRSSRMLVAALVVAAVVPASAAAEVSLVLEATNNTQTTFKVVAAGNNECYDMVDLNPGRADTIAPGQKKDIRTASQPSGSCIGSSGFQGLDVAFQRPNGAFIGSVGADNAYPISGGEGQWELFWDRANMQIRAIPKGWYPTNPVQSGTSAAGGGLFCVTGRRINSTRLGITISSNPSCAPVSATAPRATRGSKKPPPAGPGRGLGDAQSVVFDVLSIGKGACELLGPSQPWGAGACSSAADQTAWDLDNVTANVSTARTDKTPVAITTLEQVKTFDTVNDSDLPGTFAYTVSYTETRNTSLTNTFSYKFGEKLAFKKTVQIPIIAGTEISGEFSSEQNWSETKATGEQFSRADTATGTIPTKNGGTTRLVVFQGKANVAFNYFADATAGVPNTAQPLTTPMTRVTGMSAARNHPCIGYLAGDAPGSIMALGNVAFARGFTPQSPGLPLDQARFLRAIPGFTINRGGDHCPGFPDGYPASLTFKGQASVVASAAGPTSVSWAPKLPGLVYCIYFDPTKPSGVGTPTPAPAPKDTCRAGAPSSTPGAVVDAGDQPLGADVEGGDGGELVLADDRAGVTGLKDGPGDISGGGGEDVMQGSRFDDSFAGDGSDDVLMGAAGDDTLRGGDGNDTLLGGAGDDVMSDDSGDNGLKGGAGNDRMSSGDGGSGGLMGEAGSDILALDGAAPVALVGGTGDDTYRMTGGAEGERAVELDGQGVDTIRTDRSLKVPPHIERVFGIGERGLSLRAGPGDQLLYGGAGRDTLAGGAGSDLVRGGRGDDVLTLEPFGFDRAGGGAGADRFVVRTEALTAGVGGRTAGAAGGAHAIEDLRPKQGDRVVVSLTGVPRGAKPRLEFSPGSSLLRVDADGSGPIEPQNVAVLKGYKRLPAGAVRLAAR